jgi:hypothetical protein
LVLVALFVVMHSGSRAEAVCNENGMAGAGSPLSLFPPGARCIGGTDSGDVVRFDGSFLLVAPALYLLLGLVALGVRIRHDAARPRRGRLGPSGSSDE